MDRKNLRLDVTESERDMVRRAAALAGFPSMAEFCRAAVLERARAIDVRVQSANRADYSPITPQAERGNGN